MKLERILIIPDVHRPYHDVIAWNAMIKAARYFKPDIVVTLGDFADFYSVSAHSKDPSRGADLQDEVGSVLAGIDDLDSLGAKRKFFVEGNHEFRLQRYLCDKAPAVARSLSVPVLFELKHRGWNWTPYRQHLKIGKLHITHDIGAAGSRAHDQARASFGGNVVIGHTHRMGLTYTGNARGESHVGANFGWLGDPKKVDYAHRVKVAEWHHGFGLGWMEAGGVIHLQAVPIIGGRCVVSGKVIQ